MKLMAVRRVQMANTGKSDVPLPPAPPPHPGYAPNAAIHAIKRHAMEFVNPKAAAVSFLALFCLVSQKLIFQLYCIFYAVFFFLPPDGRRKGRSCHQKHTSHFKSYSEEPSHLLQFRKKVSFACMIYYMKLPSLKFRATCFFYSEN